jgi:hypothetical protein
MRCGPDYLTCYHHWHLVPKDMREQLLDAYQLARSARVQRRVKELTVALILEGLTAIRHRKAPPGTPCPFRHVRD